MINQFYSTVSTVEAPNDSNAFDLLDLGPTQTRMTPFGFLNGDGTLSGFDEFKVPTTAADYDTAFTDRLLILKPVRRLQDCLNHHLDHYLQTHDEGLDFIHHIEYVLLPPIKKRQDYSVPGILIEEWLKMQKAIMVSQHKQQRTAYLEKAYQDACNHSPGQPLSVTIKPLMLGEEMGLDSATTKRIVNELVQDGHVSCTLGMKLMMITREGVRYLEGLSEAETPVQQNVYFVNGNSNNVATGNHSVQAANTGRDMQLNVATGTHVNQSVGGMPTDILRELVTQLRREIEAEPRLAEQREDIEAELQRIDVQLLRPEPKKTILARCFDSLGELLKDGIGSVAGHTLLGLMQQVPSALGALNAALPG